jgi:xanthine dehydrogenase accessory factor
MQSIYQEVVDIEKKGETAALCTIIDTHGSAPRHEGSKMIVFPDESIHGTVGGGQIERQVIEEAVQSMKDGKSRLLHYSLVNPSKGDVGICGGQVDVYVEPITTRPLLIVVGGGHVGKAVVHLAEWLGFRVAVSDDRPEFCTPEAVPGADDYYPVKLEDLPNHVKITPQTYLVLTTRGMVIDVPGLPPLLDTPAAYIGIIGSKRRWIFARKQLIEQGMEEDKLNRIHSPIGLDIGAETPEEIALSIMAEIIMLRNGSTGKIMKL